MSDVSCIYHRFLDFVMEDWEQVFLVCRAM